MSDDDELVWRLGARYPGHDYKVFRTSFIDGTHGRAGTKRFSVIEAVDWVNVIALTPDERVVLIRQYRVGTAKVCLEIPGGMVDPGEDAEAAAARELVEETGYTARTWHHLGSMAPNPAIQNNQLHSYLALDAELSGPETGQLGSVTRGRTHEQKLEGSEVVSVDTVPLREVTELLRRGAIEHALVVAAFGHLAFRLGELRRPPDR
jgi:8-oxo-dGTP pyrophosphatase MutT (NUDIX family)